MDFDFLCDVSISYKKNDECVVICTQQIIKNAKNIHPIESLNIYFVF